MNFDKTNKSETETHPKRWATRGDIRHTAGIIK